MTTYQLAVDLEVPESEHGLDIDVLKRHEAESFASSCLAVQHDGRIDDLAELRKELSHGLG